MTGSGGEARGISPRKCSFINGNALEIPATPANREGHKNITSNLFIFMSPFNHGKEIQAVFPWGLSGFRTCVGLFFLFV